MTNYLTRYDPFGEVVSLRSAMDRLLQNVYGSGGGQEGFTGLDMDLYEKDDELVVTAALPGVKPEDIDITIQNNVLTIRGETRDENGGEDEGRGQWHRRERRYGSFFRRIELPTVVDSEGAQAHCENGLITVTLPKSEDARERRIEVQSGAERRGGRQRKEIGVQSSATDREERNGGRKSRESRPESGRRGEQRSRARR